MKKLILFLLLAPLLLNAQDPTPPSDLSGLELREWLKDNWYTPWHNSLGYGPAREAMFGTIDNEGGTLECVYSGFTQPAEEVTFPDPINTEHTVPQSFFDNMPDYSIMRADIHHLFPTHQQANSTRGSIPFGEVVDAQADEWLVGSAGNYTESSNVPSSNIDAYSEILHNVAFEPREENKGNTARAIFYFYTMYNESVQPEVSDISSIADLATLYDWHVMDPPDAEEIERNEQTQAAQGNYNPYISMPELVAPAWGFTSSLKEIDLCAQGITLRGNLLSLNCKEQVDRIRVIDMQGRVLIDERFSALLDLTHLPSGVFLIQLSDREGHSQVEQFSLSN